MKNKLGLVSLGLWILTVGLFGVFLVKGTTSTSTDQRRSVNLSPVENDLVLGGLPKGKIK